MRTTLEAKAKYSLCRAVRPVAWDHANADGTRVRPAHEGTFGRPDWAPTSAAASMGGSPSPSPTIATACPLYWDSRTDPLGSTSAVTR